MAEKGKVWVIENFMRLHEEGYCIREIAEMAGVTPPAIYAVLGKIAEKAGVSRESLLDGTVYIFGKKVKKTVADQDVPTDNSSSRNEPAEEPDTSDINVLFDKLVSDFSKLSEAIKTLITQE